VAKDETEAVEWYRKAAEQGNVDAQFRLGVWYRHGTGVAKDETEAVVWYRKAAEQNNALAQCNLGLCYDNGTGVAKDEAKAVEWYRKAAEQGNARAPCIHMCHLNTDLIVHHVERTANAPNHPCWPHTLCQKNGHRHFCSY
jgi:TPR repeat protein